MLDRISLTPVQSNRRLVIPDPFPSLPSPLLQPMPSIFLKKIAPPTPSFPAGIGAMSGILIKDHDFLKNHLKIRKTRRGGGQFP